MKLKQLTFHVFVALFFATGISAQTDTGKKIQPVVVRSRTIDVKHIVIDLQFDFKNKQAYGTTTITFSMLKACNKFSIDAGMLTINSVSISDGTVLKFEYDGGDKNDGLKITLDKIYQPGENIIVKINYHTNYINSTDPNNLWGSNGKGLRFFSPSSAEPNMKTQVWSMGEPEGNRYWFPCYDAPDDLRTTEFITTIKKPLIAISNGELLSVKDNGNDMRTYHFKMDRPYANHLTSFVVGEYIDVKQNFENIQLHSYSYKDEVNATQASVVRLPDMLKFFSEKTGVAYPYKDYSQIFVQDFGTNIGNGTASTITENMVDDYGTHADFFYLWDITEGEALAQQWFGNYVTAKDWSNVWLNKAFARYFSGLYNEYKNGSDEFLIYQNSYDQSMYLADWSSGNIQPVVNNYYDDATAFCNSNYPYLRGATVLHMLRKQMGNINWWKAINIYLTENANKTVSTLDFQKAVKEVSAQPMDWFFDQWIYKTGHPYFVVTKNYDAQKKLFTINILQTQKKDSSNLFPQVEFFRGKMQIEIDDKVESIWIEPKTENKFMFDCSKNPQLVNFDLGNTWIKEITFEKSLDELLYQFQNDNDMTGRQWAMNELTAKAKDKNISLDDKTKIYAAFRNVISGHAYWRIRSGAIGKLQALLVPPNQPAQLDNETTDMLLKVIENDLPWVRRSAIFFLGMTHDKKYADLYLNLLNDSSDRVVNAAAIALGQTQSGKAFDALVKLKDKPSWKNQSLISALWGLKELGDERGYDIAFNALSDLHSPHWTLATPVWDYRLAAAQTIVALNKSADAYPSLLKIFKTALDENDLQGVFYNTLLITTLADPRAQEVFDLLRERYKDDANAMSAVIQYETQFKESINKN